MAEIWNLSSNYIKYHFYERVSCQIQYLLNENHLCYRLFHEISKTCYFCIVFKFWSHSVNTELDKKPFGRMEVWYNWSLHSKFQPFSEVGQIIFVYQGWATLGSTIINFKGIFEISNYSPIEFQEFQVNSKFLICQLYKMTGGTSVNTTFGYFKSNIKIEISKSCME